MSSSRRSNTRAVTQTAETVTEADFPAPPAPEHEIQTGSDKWGYATGETEQGLERGVYRQDRNSGQWRYMAPLPYVLERLYRPDKAGYRALAYRMAMSPLADPADVVICDHDEVTDGTWAQRLDVPLSADDKIAKAQLSAIRDTGWRHAEARHTIPHWNRSEQSLELPPGDVGPAGYGQLGSTEDIARHAWAEIAEIAARGPKVALTLGAALGGIYVDPLKLQSFFVMMAGAAQGGKTKTQQAAASLYGDPHTVVKPWNLSRNGLVQELGGMGVMPSFRDELGAGRFPGREMEQLVLSVTQGAQRTVGTKSGIAHTSTAWHGIVISSGNDSILGQIDNEAAGARVIEIAPPITACAADSDRLSELASQHYGWPLQWLQQAGITPEQFADRLAYAEAQLELPEGGVPRTIARNLALCIAGAGLLDELLGTTTTAPAAMHVARELLEDLIAEAAERGLSPGERLLAAVTEAVVARPDGFPSRARYGEQTNGEARMSREVEGWDLSREPSSLIDVAVQTKYLDAICASAGITNSRVALRELDRTGRLIRSEQSNKSLRSRLRVGTWSAWVYKFRLTDDGVPSSDTGNTSPTGNSPSNPDPKAVTSANANNTSGEAVPSSQPVFPVPAQTGNKTGNSSTPTLSCENTNSHPPQNPSVPSVPSFIEQPHVREATPDTDGVILRLEGESENCRTCGKPAQHFDVHGPVHPRCARPNGTSYSPNGTNSPATAGSGSGKQAQARRDLCGVLDTAGMWLPGNESPVAVDMPTGIDAAYQLAVTHRLRQLWIHPSLHTPLGLPASREATVGPAEPVPHPWAETSSLDTDPAGGLAAWINARPQGEASVRTALVFPAFDDRTELATAADGAQLLQGLTRFAETLREPFYLSPNETGEALVRHRATRELTSLDPHELPEPAGAIKHLENWSRPLTDDEDGSGWVHKFDLNGAELAVFSDLWVGIGQPEHRDSLDLAQAANPKVAGYHRLQLDELQLDEQQLPGDLRLPTLTGPWEASSTDTAWLPTDMVVLLREIGAPVEVCESWIWPSSDRRVLRGYYERMRTARQALKGCDDEAGQLAHNVLKAVYTSRIGDFARTGARVYRPDIRDAVKARRTANMYRRAAKIGQQSGRFPVGLHIDALYYISDEPDPAQAAPSGMRMGAQLGQYKPEGSVPLEQVRGELGSRRFAAAFRRALTKRGES